MAECVVALPERVVSCRSVAKHVYGQLDQKALPDDS